MRFDLSREAPRLRRTIRLARTAIVGFATACLIAIVFVVVRNSFDPGWSFGEVALIAGLFWVDLTFFAIGVWGVRPPADWVEVDGVGVRFGYRSGKVRKQEWSEPGLRICLFQTEGVDDMFSDGKPSFAATVGGYAFQSVLTAPAFYAITEEAKVRGLIGRRNVSRRRGWTQLVLQK
jgi:hypothetical protein